MSIFKTKNSQKIFYFFRSETQHLGSLGDDSDSF